MKKLYTYEVGFEMEEDAEKLEKLETELETKAKEYGKEVTVDLIAEDEVEEEEDEDDSDDDDTQQPASDEKTTD